MEEKKGQKATEALISALNPGQGKGQSCSSCLPPSCLPSAVSAPSPLAYVRYTSSSIPSQGMKHTEAPNTTPATQQHLGARAAMATATWLNKNLSFHVLYALKGKWQGSGGEGRRGTGFVGELAGGAGSRGVGSMVGRQATAGQVLVWDRRVPCPLPLVSLLQKWGGG